MPLRSTAIIIPVACALLAGCGELDLEAGPGRTPYCVSGSVTALGAPGGPLEGVTITLAGAGALTVTASAADGTFRCDMLPGGVYELSADDDAYDFYVGGQLVDASVTVSLPDDDGAAFEFVAVPAGARVDLLSPNGGGIVFLGGTVTVTFCVNGEVGDVVTLECQADAVAGSPWTVLEGQGLDSGQLDLTTLSPTTRPDGSREYSYTAWSPAATMDAAKVRVTSALYPVLTDESDGTFEVTEGGVVSGRITSGGSPLAGCLVQIFAGVTLAYSTATDAEGEYRIAGMAPGTYTIVPSDPLFSFEPVPPGPVVVLVIGVPATGYDFVATANVRAVVLNAPVDGDAILPSSDTPVQLHLAGIASDADPRLSIEYSTDAGASWVVLESAWPAGGVADGYQTYTWLASDKPDTSTGQLAGVKLKVSSVTAPVVSSESVVGFTVYRLAHLTGGITTGVSSLPVSGVELSFVGNGAPGPRVLPGHTYDVSTGTSFVDGTYLVHATLAGWDLTPASPVAVVFAGGGDETLDFTAVPSAGAIEVTSPTGGTLAANAPTDIVFTTTDLCLLGAADVLLEWWDGSAWQSVGIASIASDGPHAYTGWTTPNPVSSPDAGLKIRATATEWPVFTHEGGMFDVTHVPPAPAAPAAVATMLDASRYVDFTWTDTSFNETGFEVERKLWAEDYVVMATLGPGEESYRDTTVLPGELYMYRVRAITSATTSDWAQVGYIMPDYFTDVSPALPVVPGLDVSWVDVERDGDLDLLAMTSGTSRFYRYEGGTFVESSAGGLPSWAYAAVAWADYDGDGFPDAAVAGNGEAGIFHNDGACLFSDAGAPVVGVSFPALAWGDADGDGDQDLVVAGLTAAGERTYLYLNEGGVFTESGVEFPQSWYSVVAWADADGDGWSDLLVFGHGSSPNLVYRNLGGLQFEDMGLGIPQTQHGAAAWGDADADGDLDLLLCGKPAGVQYTRLYANNGDGTFTPRSVGTYGVYDGDVAWCDYDNDGALDYLQAGASLVGRRLTVERNWSNCWSEEHFELPGTSPASIAWGDYDADGDVDFAFSGQTDAGYVTRIMRNNCATPNTPPSAPTGLAMTANEGARLSWNAATDAETPSAGLTYNLRIGTASGADDVRPGMALPSGVRLVPRIGSVGCATAVTLDLDEGTYYAAVQAIDGAYAGGAWSAEFGPFDSPPRGPCDLDADCEGPTRIRLTWTDRSEIETGYRVARASSEDGPYQTACTLPPDTQTWLNDETTSGAPVVVNTTYWYRVTAVHGTRGESRPVYAHAVLASHFTVEWSGPASIGKNTLSFADFTGDGLLDLALAGRATGVAATQLLVNDGGMSFSDSGISVSSAYNGTLAWRDYDANGDVDILLTGMSGTRVTEVWRNDGGGFTDIAVPVPGLSTGTGAWGDFDRDGRPDFVITGYDDALVPRTYVYVNVDGSTFAELTTDLPVSDSVCGDVGDYDNDGDADIAFGYGGVGLFCGVFRNDGGGTFTEVDLGLGGLSGGCMQWGDYDADGDLDLATAGFAVGTYVVKVFRNDGADTFTDIGAPLTGVHYPALAWGDYDNDGDLDLAVLGTAEPATPSPARLYRNDGADVFVDSGVPLYEVERGQVRWGDCDNDGDLDLALSGVVPYVESVSMVYRNNCTVPNTPPSAPGGLGSAVAGTDVTLSWDPATDAQTPADGLSYNIRVWRDSPAMVICSGDADASTGWRRIVGFGNAGHKTDVGGGKRGITITVTEPGTYSWQVQAIDGAFAGGAWSATDYFVVP